MLKILKKFHSKLLANKKIKFLTYSWYRGFDDSSLLRWFGERSGQAGTLSEAGEQRATSKRANSRVNFDEGLLGLAASRANERTLSNAEKSGRENNSHLSLSITRSTPANTSYAFFKDDQLRLVKDRGHLKPPPTSALALSSPPRFKSNLSKDTSCTLRLR